MWTMIEEHESNENHNNVESQEHESVRHCCRECAVGRIYATQNKSLYNLKSCLLRVSEV